jgi:hypothetical protein
VIDNVSEKAKTCLILFYFGSRGVGEKGKCQNSPGSLIYWHPICLMTDKKGSNPDRVVVSFKNGKHINEVYPTGLLDHLRNTIPVPWRDPRTDQRLKTVLYQLGNMSLSSKLY